MTSARGIWRVFVLLLLLIVAAPAARAQVVINEVVANNKTSVVDPNFPDYFPDYVELYNTSVFDIDLGAGASPWRIGDSGTNFAFAAGTIIPGFGYLVVFCDNDTSVPGVHTGFGLNATEGETVYLYRNFAVTEFVTLGIQAADYSIGRIPNSSGGFRLNLPTPGEPNVPVALGNPFNLRINEWLATNSAGADRDWFEIYNPESNAIALSGLVFADRGSSNIVSFLRPTPANSFIAPFGFVQIFASSKNNDADEVDFSLSSTSGDDIWIFASNSLTGVIDHVSFLGGQQRNESEGRLPDGGSYVDDLGNNIKLKNLSPGASNFGTIPEIVINELLAHVDPPLEDAIELHNPTTTNVSVGGWWLTNNRNNPKKYQIPPGTIIPAGGFHVFYEYQFNGTNAEPFNLNSAHGGEVYLFKADAAGELLGFRRGVTFDASENGVSFGRWINSETNVDIVPMASLTLGTTITRDDDPSLTNLFRTGLGAANLYPKVGPIVINEIHYHPTNNPGQPANQDNSLDEFIELRNFSDAPVTLFDPNLYEYQGDFYADGRTNTWRLRGGITFNLPTNITVAARGHVLVVNFDPTNSTQMTEFTNKFAIAGYPDTLEIVGPYKGKLSNGGATVQLLKPDPPQGPPLHDDERGFVPYILADLVKYNDKAPWPISTNSVGPDGFGQSLQRIVASDYGNDPLSWRGADPTPGRANGAIGLAPPVITADPAPVATVDGTVATFTVEATGSELNYRWQFNGVQINGATGSTLTIEGVTTNMAGNYRAVVINGAGIVYSADAALEVLDSGAVTNDHVIPSVSFTTPANGAQVSDSAITIAGTAVDNLAVAYVEISLNDGAFFRVVGTRTWSADILLNPGPNTIRARATDLNDNQSLLATRSITYTTNTVNLAINGQGFVRGVTSTTPLVIGQSYTITAKPASGWVFLRWAGDVSGNSTSLTFTMETGLDITAVFIANPFGGGVSGTYNGLFYERSGVRPESAGYFTYTLTSHGSYSARIFLAGKKYSCRGTLDLEGKGSCTVIRPSPLLPLTIQWSVDTESGTDTVEGTISDGTWTSTLLGDRATHHVFYNRALHGGRYTFAIPGTSGSTTEPEGDSYGLVQVGSNGKVLMTGALAENINFNHNTTLSKNGAIPLYSSLYKGQGILLGWLNLGPVAPTNHLSGMVSWVKPGGLSNGSSGQGMYPAGFTNDVAIAGSDFVQPLFTNRVLNVGQAALTLSGGDLDTSHVYIVDMRLGGNVTYAGVDKLSIRVGKVNGRFTGTLTRVGTKPIKFTGAFLQSDTNAMGFLIGTNRVGRVTIEPDR